jgi:hypothetical protein
MVNGAGGKKRPVPVKKIEDIGRKGSDFHDDIPSFL